MRHHLASVVLCLGLPLLATPARADHLEIGIAKCAAISGELQRLQCFDDLASSNQLTPSSRDEQHAGDGKWEVHTTTNPIDDSKTVYLGVAADNAQSRFGQPIMLVLRCLSTKTDAYVVWNEYLGREASVTSRIGDSKAITQQWLVSTDGRASFAPGNAIDFIKRLSKSTSFVAQVTPYNESPKTAMFDITGLESQMPLISETCNWGRSAAKAAGKP